MNKILVFCVMIVMVIPVFGVKIGTLPEEVLKPELIRVQGNELLVVEGPTIFIFSLDDLKLKRKFGKEGEGPGEFKKVPNFSNNIIVHPSSILVESLDKISYFSREGELIKEKRKYPGSLKVMPVGENFAVTGFLQGKEGKLIAVLSIFNSEMEKKQELYQQKFSQQGISEADLIPDSLNFWVYDNKIFVEESPNGFFIEVFDKEGKKLYQIEKQYTKIKITENDKNDAINRLKEEPIIKLQGWENIKKLLKFKFFDSFPAIRDIFVADQKIYIQTFVKKENQDEFIIMDLKGEILKKIFLPSGQLPGLLVEFLGLGPRYYSIVNDKIYYLKENVENEEWELYVIDIK